MRPDIWLAMPTVRCKLKMGLGIDSMCAMHAWQAVLLTWHQHPLFSAQHNGTPQYEIYLSSLHIQLVLQVCGSPLARALLQKVPPLPFGCVYALLKIPLGGCQLSLVLLGRSCIHSECDWYQIQAVVLPYAQRA